MRLKTIPEEFKKALPVLSKIKAAGYEAYFVGGSVRDVLLDKPIHDVDIATSGFPEEIKSLFPRTIDVGIQHGTVMVLADNQETYEITTFRTESTYQDFRRPDQVEFVRNLAEDLKRRDFTINAFALEEDGEIIDLFDGLEDLAAKIIRAVRNPHERFREDALRMMRGLRFVSQLGFSLESETAAAIEENHALLAKISVERINVEFVKFLLGEYRSLGLKYFVETECFEYCPGLKNQGAALLRFADLPEDTIKTEAQAWTLLLKCLDLSPEAVGPFLKAWKTSNQMIKQVQNLLKGLNFRLEQEWTATMLYEIGADVVLVEELRPFFSQEDQSLLAEKKYQKLPIHHLQELAIGGKEILASSDQPPGKWVSELLHELELAVLNGEVANDSKALLTMAAEKG
ncbi:CCA tRNA nucleotidyltransferase [Enterococcus sp. LJL90]